MFFVLFFIEDGMVTLQSFSSFSRKYHEDLSIADQFFHSMDMTGDGKLSELDFILQALTLDHDRKYMYNVDWT